MLIAAGAIAWAVGMRLARRGRPVTGGVLGVSTCRMLTVGTVVLAAAGFLLGLFPPG